MRVSTQTVTQVMNPPVRSKYDQRREAVLIAAAAVFAEKGFHGASTQQIAERLNMKQASLYYYFRSKEAALEAVCLYGISESVARLRQLVLAEEPLPDKIYRVIHSHIYNLQTRCDCMIVFTQQRRYLPEERRGVIREQSQDYEALLKHMFDQAVARGEMTADIDPVLAVRALTGLCNSVASWFQQSPAQDIDHIARQYARLFFAGIQSQTKESAT